jgi:hypothetical protein
MTEPCEHGNEPSSYMKDEKIILTSSASISFSRIVLYGVGKWRTDILQMVFPDSHFVLLHNIAVHLLQTNQLLSSYVLLLHSCGRSGQ